MAKLLFNRGEAKALARRTYEEVRQTLSNRKVRDVITFVWKHAETFSGRKALFLGIVVSIVLFRVVTTQAVGSGIYYVKNASANIGSFPSAIPNNSFRVNTSSTNAASVTSISSGFVGSSSATLSPTTGWTQTVSTSQDDANHKVNFGFNTTFNGTSYDGVYISSNTYFTFGTGSSNYSGLGVSNPAYPGVFMCAQDNSYQKVFYKLDSAGVMRVRYEGNNSTSGTVGSPTIVYEAVFYSGQSYVDIYMGANSACPAATAPTVSSVSSNKANGSYKAGEVIDIDVTFSEAVTSTGNVTVTLETGSTDRTCTFTVSSSNFGTCNYTVQAGDTSADLTVNSVTGTIRNASSVALSNTTPVTNLAANKALVIDTTNPTVSSVTSSLANGSYKAGQVVPVQVVFAESVTVAGGIPQLVIQTGSPITTTLNYASGSGSNTLVFNYTVQAANYSTDLDHGSTTALSLNGATIRDTAGNNATLTLATPGASGSLAANKALVIDNTAPGLTLSSTSSSLTNAAIPVTAVFTESVTGFVVGDISVTNGTAGSFSGSGASYAFTVTPSGQGAVSISVAGSTSVDLAGNANTASNSLIRTYDSIVPTVSISTGVASPTLQTPIPFTATFSESVTGMTLADMTVTSGTAGNFVAVSDTVYTFDVSPTGHPVNNVEVYVSVAASKAQDAAGNNNSASDSGTPYNIRFDNHSPTVSLSSVATEPTKSSAIVVTATFSESVTGFVVGDIDVTNGTAGSFSGSGTGYTFEVTPSSQGVVTVQVPANIAQDGATNLNLVSNTLSRTYDSIAPTVVLSSAASNPTNTSPISVTATFSESVTGFVVGDLTLGNASATDFSGSGLTYTFNLVPSGQGAVTATVASASSSDEAGNDNSASNTLSRTYDSQGPTLAEVTPVPSSATDPTPSYTFSSSEAASLVYAGDCSSSTSNASSGNNTITFDLLVDGTYSNCAIVATDTLGNASSPLIVSAFTVDGTQPTLILTSSSPNPTNTSPIPVTASFSESVTGFVVGDIDVTNGTADNFSGSDSEYTFEITPSGEGLVSVNIASGAAQDAAGNNSTSTSTLSRTYDSVAPTVTLTSSSPNPTNTSPISVTATFSESVSALVLGDIAVTNGAQASLTGSGTTYSFIVTPSGQGAVTVSIPANGAQDDAGNLNLESNSLSRTYDSVAPTVTVGLSDSTLTSGETAVLTIVFSEAVTNFDNTDITTVDNGTLSTVATADNITWTATFTPTAGIDDSTNIITVTKTGLTDLAGNAGVNKNDTSNYTVETLRPTVASVSSGKANGWYKAGDVIDIDVTFSEVVTSTGNVTVTLETGSTDRTCTFTISSSATGTCDYTIQAGDASLDLNVNSVTGTIVDAANNSLTNTVPVSNLASNKGLGVDTISPVLALVSLVTSSSNKTAKVTYSSDETGTAVYAGSCGSSSSSASVGNNSITFTGLAVGTYANCVISLSDLAGNISTALTVPSFTIETTTTTVGSSVARLISSTPTSSALELNQPTPASGDKIILNLFPEFLKDVGKKLDLVVNQIIYFRVAEKEHSATITEVTDQYVTFILASKPKYAKLLVGETGRYDVDEDGNFDVEVSVLGVAGKYAGMSFKRLMQPAAITQPPAAIKVNWIPYIIAGTVIAAGLFIGSRRRKQRSELE